MPVPTSDMFESLDSDSVVEEDFQPGTSLEVPVPTSPTFELLLSDGVMVPVLTSPISESMGSALAAVYS